MEQGVDQPAAVASQSVARFGAALAQLQPGPSASSAAGAVVGRRRTRCRRRRRRRRRRPAASAAVAARPRTARRRCPRLRFSSAASGPIAQAVS